VIEEVRRLVGGWGKGRYQLRDSEDEEHGSGCWSAQDISSGE